MLLVFFCYSLSCWLGSCSTIHEKPQVNSLGHWGFHDSLLAAVAILASSFQHWKRFSHETYETYETAQDFHWGLNSRQEMSPPGTAWHSLTQLQLQFAQRSAKPRWRRFRRWLPSWNITHIAQSEKNAVTIKDTVQYDVTTLVFTAIHTFGKIQRSETAVPPQFPP